MKRILKIALLVGLCITVLLTSVSCAWINETILGKEHEHRFKKDVQVEEPTCVSELKKNIPHIKKLKELVSIAMKNGSKDNLTAVLVTGKEK